MCVQANDDPVKLLIICGSKEAEWLRTGYQHVCGCGYNSRFCIICLKSPVASLIKLAQENGHAH